MNTETTKQKAEPLAAVLLALAALLGALILLKVAGLRTTKASAEMTVDRAIRSTRTESDAVETHLAQAKSMAEELKRANLFVVKPARQHPVKEVLGILGNEVLIDEKWYKAGDRIGEATILAIEPTKVKIVWDGRETEFFPIAAGDSAGARGPGGSRPSRQPGGRPPLRGGRPKVVTGDRGGLKGPPALPPDERARLRKRYMNMSPEEKEKFRQQKARAAQGEKPLGVAIRKKG